MNYMIMTGVRGNEFIFPLTQVNRLIIDHDHDDMGLFHDLDFNEIFNFKMEEMKSYRGLNIFVDAIFGSMEVKVGEIEIAYLIFADENTNLLQYAIALVPESEALMMMIFYDMTHLHKKVSVLNELCKEKNNEL